MKSKWILLAAFVLSTLLFVALSQNADSVSVEPVSTANWFPFGTPDNHPSSDGARRHADEDVANAQRVVPEHPSSSAPAGDGKSVSSDSVQSASVDVDREGTELGGEKSSGSPSPSDFVSLNGAQKEQEIGGSVGATLEVDQKLPPPGGGHESPVTTPADGGKFFSI